MGLMSTDENRKYEIADVIGQLGDEIREAMRRHQARGETDLLDLKECSIELGLTWDKKGSGEIDFKIFKLGGEVDKSNTETITITLQPALIKTKDGQKTERRVHVGLGGPAE